MTFSKFFNNNRNPKAALYVRVSTLHQIDKDSLPFQKQELENYCKYALGIDDCVIFEDAGYSGKNTDRPSYQRMMTQIRKGEFTHVCVWKIDRISRNLLDFAAMYEELKKYRIIFVSKSEQFDTSSAMGEAMLKIILIFAELERKLTSERVTGIMLDRATKGLWNGARMPLGYRWNDEIKYPEIDEVEASTIHFIYDKYEELKSSLLISRFLNQNEIKTKRDGEWTSKTISDIIRNPFYKGTYRYNYRESARGAIKDESEWIIVPNNHPAIITEKQWEHCNKIMDTHRKTKNTSSFRKCKHTHIFSEILKCTDCGGGFSSNKDKQRRNGWRPSNYRCNRAIRMRDCTSIGVSDVYLGPFVLNYIANFVRLQRKDSSYTSESVEKALLSGKCFINIARIDSVDLQATLRALNNQKTVGFQFNPNLNIQTKTEYEFDREIDIEILRQKEEKLQEASKRLFDLYLYDSSAMSQKDYMLKKVELEVKLQEVRNAINNTPEELSGNVPTNISFIKKASALVVNQFILSKKEISFEELAIKCDADILKDLVQSTIKKIGINKGIIEYIEFQSGLIHHFIYKE